MRGAWTWGLINWLLGFDIFVCFVVLASIVRSSFFVKGEKVLLMLGLGAWGVCALIAATLVLAIYMNYKMWKVDKSESIITRRWIMRKTVVLLIPNTFVCCVFLVSLLYTLFVNSLNIFLCLEGVGVLILIRSNMVAFKRIYIDWPKTKQEGEQG